MSLCVPCACLCEMTDTFLGEVRGCSGSPCCLLGFRESVCADALAAAHVQAGMISGCSCIAGGLGCEQAVFGQCRCMRESVAKAFRGFHQHTQLPWHSLPSQVKTVRVVGCRVWDTPWQAVLAQPLCRGIALSELYKTVSIKPFGVSSPCLFLCMVQRLHLSRQKSFPLMGEYPCISS